MRKVCPKMVTAPAAAKGKTDRLRHARRAPDKRILKEPEKPEAGVALHFAHYNFCRVHSTLKCTPAMEAGIAGSVWSFQELLKAA